MDANITQVVMGYFGVQYADEKLKPQALAALQDIVELFAERQGPQDYDATWHQDAQGYHNFIVVGYWNDPKDFCAWLNATRVKQFWQPESLLGRGLGFFREIISPRAEQFETLYAFKEQLPGVGALMNAISGDIQEHGYWGSMRDRFPISQTDNMASDGELTIISGDPQAGGHVVVRGHNNIALIRSGQDWEGTEEKERSLYLDEIEPTLRAGMDFLRDQGAEVGCYTNRYVQYIDLQGNLQEKSYNIGHWRSLRHLEEWAASHPTHLRIFSTFVRVAAGFEKLRLYHEVSVSDRQTQLYEYYDCHSETGMLRDAVTAS
ncbi:phenylacetaldoxime dehydratase family protein [Pectobacterium sp. B2J-2]|uniref:phenylacetaldoxime dehydratase family protein n=1 Tax=Pectobacterium sp. B2J-2 TaxID=3385372 RepID=UPI0038FC6D82